METSVNLKKKVYLCYSYLNNMYIDSLCRKIDKEGFQAIVDRTGHPPAVCRPSTGRSRPSPM